MESTTAETNKIAIAGDVLQTNLAKLNNTEHAELLQWLYYYAAEKSWSLTQMAKELNISSATLSRLFNGNYINQKTGIHLSPPAELMAAIRRIKELSKVDMLKKSAGRIKTPTVDDIWRTCKKAWAQAKMAFIFGEPQIGKTEALKWFKDENNHGNTIYVDLNGVTGVQDVYRAFAKALKLGDGAPSRLKDRVYRAINKRMLIIVDEFHQITYAYKKGSSKAMVHALKAIHDICECGMVICSTDIGREQMESGVESKLCSQLLKRGTIQHQLPNGLPIADVRAIVEAYKLDFPAPVKNELWKNFMPLCEGHKYCHDIALSKGINYLILVLQDGNIKASKEKRALKWNDFEKAHEMYLRMSAPKVI